MDIILLFRKNSDEHTQRLKQLIDQYKINKAHDLTTEELEFACKNAWRNSARCIGRINWQNLKVKAFLLLLKYISFIIIGKNSYSI